MGNSAYMQAEREEIQRRKPRANEPPTTMSLDNRGPCSHAHIAHGFGDQLTSSNDVQGPPAKLDMLCVKPPAAGGLMVAYVGDIEDECSCDAKGPLLMPK